MGDERSFIGDGDEDAQGETVIVVKADPFFVSVIRFVVDAGAYMDAETVIEGETDMFKAIAKAQREVGFDEMVVEIIAFVVVMHGVMRI